MTSKVDTTALLMEQRKQNILWEQARPGSRQEQEAAEAATRAAAELDAALCDGAHLPVPWQLAQYPADVTEALARVERARAATSGNWSRSAEEEERDALWALADKVRGS